MYVCKDFNGTYFIASDNLAAALDRETVRAPVNVALAMWNPVGLCPICGEHIGIEGMTTDGRLIGSCGDAFRGDPFFEDDPPAMPEETQRNCREAEGC